MDIRELKNYIYDNNYVEQILESIGCHHIKYHTVNEYWTAANPDGDNRSAIVVYNNESLNTIDFTRNIGGSKKTTDIIDLISYIKGKNFIESTRYLCDEIGVSYYYDFEEHIPESLKMLKLLDEMSFNIQAEKEVPLKPRSEKILTYYKPYVNDLFYKDNISYETQKEFEIGYDEESNRYTIPVRSELGDLVGVKGRYFEREVPQGENKYLALEPYPKSRILYGLYKNFNSIQDAGIVYVFESEKSVLQLHSYGYFNAVATGGKMVSMSQVDILVRTEAKIILCMDKDVTKGEIEELSEQFPRGINVFYIYDEEDILDEKESPSDVPSKWEYLVKNNVYKIR